jgi:hypothetical protein
MADAYVGFFEAQQEDITMAGTKAGQAHGTETLRANIEGIDELVKNISRFKENVIEAVKTAAEVGQARVVNAARRSVPVKTGALQNSIGGGRIIISNKDVQAEVVAAMQYASYVEKRKPYLRPALDANEQGFVKSVQRAVQSAKAK